MHQLFEKNLLSTKDAGELSGYTSDYLARLARSGKIIGKRIGHSWFIDQNSLELFLDQQGDRKIDYARALARAREVEYRAHHSVSNRALKTLSKPVDVPFVHDIKTSFRTHALSLSVAALVVVSGALVARAAPLANLATDAGTLAAEVASGFVATFGNIPSHLASKINAVSHDAHLQSVRVAKNNQAVTASLAFDFPEVRLLQQTWKSDFSQTRVALSNSGIQEVRLLQQTWKSDFQIQKSISDTLAFITSPTHIKNYLFNQYRAMGDVGYRAVLSAMHLDVALINRAGDATLALAASGRDAFSAGWRNAPAQITRMNLAIGNGVINATHAAIHADTLFAYAAARVAPEAGRAVIALVVKTGDTLAGVTSRTPEVARVAFLSATEAPARLAPALAEAVFNVEYSGASHFVAVSNNITGQYALALRSFGEVGYAGAATVREVTRQLASSQMPWKSDFRTAIRDAYLGMMGKSALALDTLTHTPMLAAVLPSLSVGEQVALTVYTTIHDLFTSTTRALASLFAPAPAPAIIVVNNTPKLSVSTTTTQQTVNSKPQIINSYPTYTTVVQGVSPDFMNQSLASLRLNILATISNVNDRISRNARELAGLKVTDGNFIGGSLTKGVLVSATKGNFDSLIAGATSLGNTSVSGDLTVSGVITPSIISATDHISAPYFIATSTTATSTFAGSLAVGTDKFVVDAATGFVGIGTTTAAGLFTVGTSSPLLHIDSNTGNIGINTLASSYRLDVNGTLRTTGDSYFNSSGFFGTSIDIGGTATSTGTSLMANGAYLIDSGSTLSINTTNNQPVIFGTGNVNFPNASTTNFSIASNLWIGGNATTTADGTFTTNGFIGISNTSPTYNLDVTGLVHVTGLVDAEYFVATSTTATSIFAGNVTLGDLVSADLVSFNSRINTPLIPSADNQYDLGDGADWLRWRTGYFGTSIGIAGTATSTGVSLMASGAYLIDSGSTLSINTTNNQPVSFGTGNVLLPFASSTALTLASALWIGGNATTTSNGNFTTNGNLVIHGTTNDIAGTLNLSGGLLTSTAGLSVTSGGAGDLTLDAGSGNINIASGDSILATGANSDIGSSGIKFNTLWVDSIQATHLYGTIVTGTTDSPYWTINAANTSDDTVPMGIIFERGNVVPNATLSWNVDDSAKRFEFNQPLFIQGSTTITTLDLKGLAGQTADLFRISSSAGTNLFNITSAGNVGIGVTVPSYKLDVDGLGHFTGLVDADHFVATSSSATSLFNGHLQVVGNTLLSNATTTNLFSTTASSTNLFAQSANLGTLAGAVVSSLTTNYLPKWNSTIGAFANSLVFDNGTNVGIGTSTPSTKFSVGGEAGDTTGHGYFTGGLGIGIVNTVAGTLQTSGDATFGGAGTFTGGLTVSGLCVAADTRLRRRRKARKGEEDEADEDGYIYDEVEIIDIKSGDEIQSLDEKTGKLVWSRVKQLAFMGVKDIFKITTAGGKTIRTTGNHPYYVRESSTGKRKQSHEYPNSNTRVIIDYANVKAWARNQGLFVDLRMLKSVFSTCGFDDVSIYYGTDENDEKSRGFINSLSSKGYVVFTKELQRFSSRLDNLLEQSVRGSISMVVLNAIRKCLRLNNVYNITITTPKANFDVEITMTIMNLLNDGALKKLILFSGDGDFAALVKYAREAGVDVSVFAGRKFLSGKLIEWASRYTVLERFAKAAPGVFYAENQQDIKTTRPRGGVVNCSSNILDAHALSSMFGLAVDNERIVPGEGKWKKVTALREGMMIAVAPQWGKKTREHAAWDNIVSVERLPAEDVYDIEVEGTHNFIGNGVVAHNTAIFNNASTTQLSVTNKAYFGGTATSTFDSAGALTLATPLLVSSGGTGQNTFASSQLLYGAGTGALQSVATSTINVGTSISVTSGTLGYQIGGANVTLGIANNALTLAQFPTIAANSVIGNLTGGTATPTAVATSSLFTWNGTGLVVRDTSPTITTPIINTAAHVGGTWVADAAWTLPALTFGGAITGNSQNITGLGTINGLAITANTGTITTGVWNGTAVTDTYVADALTIAAGTISGASNTMSLGSDATGDTYYRNSSGYLTRLALGTGGFVLTSSGGLPSWQATSTIGIQGRGNGSANQIAYFTDANTITSSASYLWNDTTKLLTVTGNASTTQLTTTGSTYLATTNGNVGIGTTNPRGKLEIPSNTVGSVIIGTPNVITDATVDIGSASGAVALSLTDSVNAHTYFGFQSSGPIGSYISSDSNLTFKAGSSPAMTILSGGNVGIGTTLPTAVLHLKAGTATASTAPLKFTSGTNLTTAEAGAMEYDGTQLYFSPSTTRNIVGQISGGTALTLGSIPFATTSGYLTQDNANLFWDNTNKRLGVGTTVPAAKLEVYNADTETNTIQELLKITHKSTGTPANGIGVEIGFHTNTTTIDDVKVASIIAKNVNVATNNQVGWLSIGINNQGVMNPGIIMNTLPNTASGYAGVAIGRPSVPDYGQMAIKGIVYTGASNGSYLDLSSNTVIDIVPSATFNVLTNSTNRLKIDSDGLVTIAQNLKVSGAGNSSFAGSVGIGITTPTSLLHTVSSAAKTTAYTGILHSITDTSSTASINKIGMDIESTGTWNGTSAINTGLVVNATGGTTNYAATFMGGNVGIGTTNPGAPLDVTGAVNTVIAQITAPFGTTGTPQYSSLKFNNSTGAWGVSEIRNYNDGANALGSALTFSTANGSTGVVAEQMRITKEGNVGIGTTNPQSDLDVYTVTTGGTVRLSGNTDSAFGELIFSSNNPTYVDYGASIKGFGASSIDSGILTFNTGYGATRANSEAMRINQNGNVGIGTTNPGAWDSERLTVKAASTGAMSIGTSDFVLGTTGSMFGVTFGSATGNTYTSLRAHSTGGAAWNNLILQSGGGNVGIGTTNPGAKIDVLTSSTGLAGNFTQNGDGYGVAINSSGSSATRYALAVRSADTNTPYLYVTTETGKVGNVGIGTTGPGGLLTLYSTTAQSLQPGFSNLVLEYDKSGDGAPGSLGAQIVFKSRWFSGATDLARTGAIRGYKTDADGVYGGGIQLLYQPNGGADLAPGLTLQHQGNVGIGTTGPLNPLHIVKTSAGAVVNELRLSNLDSSAGTGVAIAFNPSALEDGDGNLFGKIILTKLNAGANYLTRMDFNVADADGTARTGLSILGGQGNVGIGTTGPNYLLDVEQSANSMNALFAIGNVNTGTAAQTRMCFGNNSSACSGQIIYNGSNFTGAGNVMTVTNANNGFLLLNPTGGNVGIGTTNPGYEFVVQQSTNISGSASVGWLSSDVEVMNGVNDVVPLLTLERKSVLAGMGIVPGGGLTLDYRLTDQQSQTSPLAAQIGVKNTIGLNSNAQPALFFNTGNNGTMAEAMRITYGGNVGIGTTGPGNLLQVNSAVTPNFSQFRVTANGAGGISMYNYSADNAFIGFDSDHTDAGTIARDTTAFEIYKIAGGLRFYGDSSLTSGSAFTPTTRMIIQSGGNVGIGTTNPLKQFVIGGSSAVLGSVSATTNENGNSLTISAGYGNGSGKTGGNLYLGSGRGNSSAVGGNIYLGAAIGNSTGLGDTWVTVVGDTGNVGIGTTGPGQKLDIHNNPSQSVFGRTVTDATDLSSGWTSTDGTYTVTSGLLGQDGGGTTGNWGVYAGGVRMVVQQTGNVGIGTTGPGGLLHLSQRNDAGLGSDLILQNPGTEAVGTYTGVHFNITNSATQYRMGGIFYSVPASGYTGYGRGDIVFAQNPGTSGNATLADAVVTIKTNGNVGIGTTGPDVALVVSGSDRAKLSLSNTSTGGIPWYLMSSDNAWGLGGGKLVFGTDAGSTGAKMVIQSNGNVGIGTTGPNSQLDLGGLFIPRFPTEHWTEADIRQLRISGVNNNQYGGSAIILGLRGGVAGAIIKAEKQSATASHDSTDLLFYTVLEGDASANEVMRLTSSGNVGIGTTTPGKNLEVYGSNPVVRLGDNRNLADTSWAGTEISALEFYTNDPSANSTGVKAAVKAIGNSASFGGTLGSDLAFYYSKVNDGALYEGMRINNGNVGIGTTNPTSKLVVNGTVAFPLIPNDAGSGSVCYTGATGALSTSTLGCTGSSLRFKNNIQPLGYGLADILKIKSVSFIYKPEMFVSGNQIGFIAEDMANIIPEIVGFDSQGRPSNIDYGRLTPVLVGAVQELNVMVRQIQALGGVLTVEVGTDAQCVTGDTKLRRKKKRPDADFDELEFDEICVRDVAVGDEIASLDERTGRIVYSRVNALIDMGTQEIFELKTASGRTIRTTGNHPYLVRRPSAELASETRPV